MKRFAIAGATVALTCSMFLGATAPTAAAGGPPLTVVSCGDVITTSITVANDIGPCPDDGLVIGADGIKVLFGGHAVVGTETPGDFGVRNEGFDDVTIKQANIRDFAGGVLVQGAKRNLIQNVNATSNPIIGFSVASGAKHVLRGNDASENGVHGFIVSSAATVLESNIAEKNGEHGFQLHSIAGELTLAKNKAIGNGEAGVSMLSVDGAKLKKNLLSGNVGDGLLIDEGGSHEVFGNRMLGNKGRGVFADGSEGNFFEDNEISDNATAGFLSKDGSANVLKANLVEFNAGHGISSLEGDIKVKLNRAKLNGFVNGADDDFGLGIFVPQTATGGGNFATGNDDPAQVSKASLLG